MTEFAFASRQTPDGSPPLGEPSPSVADDILPGAPTLGVVFESDAEPTKRLKTQPALTSLEHDVAFHGCPGQPEAGAEAAQAASSY